MQWGYRPHPAQWSPWPANYTAPSSSKNINYTTPRKTSGHLLNQLHAPLRDLTSRLQQGAQDLAKIAGVPVHAHLFHAQRRFVGLWLPDAALFSGPPAGVIGAKAGPWSTSARMRASGWPWFTHTASMAWRRCRHSLAGIGNSPSRWMMRAPQCRHAGLNDAYRGTWRAIWQHLHFTPPALVGRLRRSDWLQHPPAGGTAQTIP